MTTVQIELPEELAQRAKEAGLLSAEAIEALVRKAVREKSVDDLFAAADRMAAAAAEPMTMEEIQAEVNAVRAARRARRT